MSSAVISTSRTDAVTSLQATPPSSFWTLNLLPRFSFVSRLVGASGPQRCYQSVWLAEVSGRPNQPRTPGVLGTSGLRRRLLFVDIVVQLFFAITAREATLLPPDLELTRYDMTGTRSASCVPYSLCSWYVSSSSRRFSTKTVSRARLSHLCFAHPDTFP